MRTVAAAVFTAACLLGSCWDASAQTSDLFQSVVPTKPRPKKPPRPRPARAQDNSDDDSGPDMSRASPADSAPSQSVVSLPLSPLPTQPAVPAPPLAPSPSLSPASSAPVVTPLSQAITPAPVASPSQVVSMPVSPPTAPAAPPSAPSVAPSAPPLAPSPMPPASVASLTPSAAPPPSVAPITLAPLAAPSSSPPLPPTHQMDDAINRPFETRRYYAFPLPAPYCDDAGSGNATCTTIVGIDRFEPGKQTWYIRWTSLIEPFRSLTSENPWRPLSVTCEATSDGSSCKTKNPQQFPPRYRGIRSIQFLIAQGGAKLEWDYSLPTEDITIEGRETDIRKFTSLSPPR
jgi:hypothetical protein